MSEERKISLVTEVDSTGARQGFNEVKRAAGEMAAAVSKSGEQAERGMEGIGKGAGSSSTKVEAAQRNLIGSIQRTTAAMEAGGRTTAKYYETLAQQRGVDTGALAPYLAQLRAVEAAQARSNAALNNASPVLDRVGLSAKQTAAALRGVPAQFTDIFTSLQGGQAPLTIFLQQGGQLKDMFGGAGNAARAMGGYVLGLINPFTLAAAAVGVLAVAYNSGSKEADAYTRAIVMSGNAAGVTSGQLSDMARNISATVGTQGQAAEAIAALAGTGRIAANNLQEFGAVAVNAQRSLGISAKDMARDFAELGKDPVKASERLTEQYRYLTAATYEQIKALEEQGRKSEAAEVAQRAFATAMSGRAGDIKESLGSLERAWAGIASVAKGAWDAMLNVGREDTTVEKLERVRAQIAKAQKPFDPSVGGNAEARAQLKANLEMEASLVRQISQAKTKAEADAANIKLQEAQVAWSREGDKYLSKRAQMEREVAQARATGAAAGQAQAVIDERIAKIRREYADKGGAAAIKSEASAYAGLTASIGERIAATQREAAGLAPLTESQRLQVALNEQLAAGKLKLTPLHKAAYEAQIKELSALEASAASRKQLAKFQTDYAAGIALMTAAQEKAIASASTEADNNERLAETYGMSKAAIEAMELARLEDQLAQRSSLGLTLDEIEGLEKLIAAKKRSVAALSSVEQRDQVKRINDEIASDYKRLSQSIEQSLTDALMRGFEKGKSFGKNLVDTLKNMFKTLVLQPTIQGVLAPTAGAIASMLPGAAQASSGGAIGSTIGALGNAYSLVSGGLTLAGGLGTGFMGSVAGGLMGAGAGSGLTSAAGLAIGEGIAGVVGPSVAGAISTGLGAVAAAMPWMAGIAVGAALLKKAFGHGDKEVTGTTLNGMFGAQGFVGTTDSAWKKEGGWFRSDKTGVDKASVDSLAATSFASAYDQIKASSADFAKVLGINADSIKDRSQSLSIAITKDEEANKKAIADFFVGVGDTIAQELLPTVSSFAKEGEAASTTLQRIATNYATIDASLASLGLVFGTVGIESIAARERLVSLSGGIEAMVQNAAGFAQNFLTEAERIAPVASAVTKAMSDLGFATVDTRDEFKALVQGLDLTTESGATNYAALMKLQAAFAQVHPVIEATTDAIDEAALAAKAQADALSAIKSAATGLVSGVDQSFSVLEAVVSRERTRASQAHEVTMRRLQQSIDTETAAITKHKALADAIAATLGQLSNGAVDPSAARSQAQAQIQAAIAIAKAGGVLPSADSLRDSLSVLSRDSTNQFSSLADYQRDAAQTQNSLQELGKLSESTLTIEERSLKALEDQKAAVEQAYKAEVERLDDILANARGELDVLKGMDTTLLSIADALNGFGTAVLNANKNPVVAATSAVNSAYQSALGRAPEAAALEYWQNAAAGGMSPESISGLIRGSAEAQAQELFQSLLGRPGDAAGIDYWTRALSGGMSQAAARDLFMQSDEYQARNTIVTASASRSRVASSGDSSLTDAITLMAAKMERQQIALDKIAESTGMHADLFDRVSGGGNAIMTEAA